MPWSQRVLPRKMRNTRCRWWFSYGSDWPRTSAPLTAREIEVLRLVTAGKTNQEIGVQLAISEKTVEKHLREIFIKLGVTSRVEAAVRAVRENLV
jgi:DNA-binding NarL/FixJ family response regulator